MNAIIMAAGTSSRFVPLCWERPKGLLEVKGGILIERQIKQLKAAGVDDITIVTGYMADKYDVTAEQSIDRANQRIKQSTADAFATTVQGYASVTPETTNIRLRNGQAKYALYPVWLLNTTWKGKKYTFAMNGQTGKLAGDLPLDKSAYRKWLFGLTGIVGAAAFLIAYLLWLL